MKTLSDHKSHLRLAVVQQLRLYGIKIKHWNSKQRPVPEGVKVTEASDNGKTFGTPLHELPHAFVQDYGNIPSFVVSACNHLELHVSTEGLFRKSGSVVRLKALKSKLDVGDCCLAAAPPCDVAGLLKQFFRELPEPILKPELHDAFFKAQQLGSEEEKTAATLLLSCLLSDHTNEILRYFFGFLRRVSLSADENKMDSSNLALIFAPNLFQSGDGCEKMSASTEKKLRLQAAVVRTLIDHAANIGLFTDLILEKIPAMLGVDAACATPMLENYEEGEWMSPGERIKRRQRRSVGDMFSEALNKLKTNRTPTSTPQADRNGLYSMVTPVVLTPSTKRKLPADSCQGFSNKKRKFLKHNLGFDFLPSSLFSGGLTPASAQSDASPCVSLENSQNSPSLFIIGAKHFSSSGRQRNKRYENKNLHRLKSTLFKVPVTHSPVYEISSKLRVESGKTGCFSPKATRKEMVHRSLRLKFRFGKSSRENLADVYPSTSKSETIGWRLANQQETEQQVELSKANAKLSPVKAAKTGSKMSKSEENLLTPKCSDGTNYRMSWSGPGASELSASDNEGTPPLEDLNPSNFYSEPVLITGKPPVIPPELRQVPAISKPDKCPVSSPFGGEEKHMAEKTLLMIKKAFSESGSDLQCLIADSRSLLKAENKSTEKVAESEADLQTSVTETITQISPAAGHSNKKSNVKLDISDATKNPAHTEALSLVAKEHCAFQNLNDSVKTENCVTRNVLNSTFLMSENDKCPLSFNSHDCVSCEQSNIISKEAKSQQSITNEDQGLILSAKAREAEIPDSAVIVKSGLDIPQSEGTCHAKPHLSTVQSSDSKSSVIVKRLRVSDHIQRFNNLSLNDPGGKKVKSPLSFERTPVRQSVRRINSLSEIRKQTSASILMNSETIAAPLQKSVSCSSTFASRVELVSKNSAPSKPCSVFLNIQPTSSLAAQRNSALRTLRSNGDSLTRPDRLGTNPKVNDPEVGIMQSKSVLEDLTNQETPRTTGKGTLERKQRMGNTVATNEAIGLARKLSGKEKIRYKGSPKNPISKTQLLPTSRPLEL